MNPLSRRQVLAALAATGSLNEYYHPDTGAALSHKGFMDWNLLVLEMLGEPGADATWIIETCLAPSPRRRRRAGGPAPEAG